MLEVLGQYCFCKLLVLLTAFSLSTIHHASGSRLLGRTSRTTKLSPSFPHRTTDAYWGSSSILHPGLVSAHHDMEGPGHTCRACEPGGDVSAEAWGRSCDPEEIKEPRGNGVWARTHKVAGITSSRLRSHVAFGRHVVASVGGPREVCVCVREMWWPALLSRQVVEILRTQCSRP